MLIRFSLENVFCFEKETEISLVAATEQKNPLKYLPENHLIEKKLAEPCQLLKTAAIFGANSHGKSKLIRALGVMQALVLGDPCSKKLISPFLFNTECANKPCEFYIAFHHQDTDWHYGFSVDQECVHDEWLYTKDSNGQEHDIFSRELNEGIPVYEFGDVEEIEHLHKAVAQTSKNELFVRAAFFDGVEKVAPVFEWFDKVLHVVPNVVEYQPNTKELGLLSSFLSNCDTGIDKIFEKENPESGNKELCVLYKGNGCDFKVNLQNEAFSIRKLVGLISLMLDARHGKVFIVDDIDQLVHPNLFLSLLKSWFSCENSQLVFSSHNTNLLDNTSSNDNGTLRRDEIWFVDKDRNGSASLYPLTDFSLKKDMNIKRGYMQGRFGAVPFISYYHLQLALQGEQS